MRLKQLLGEIMTSMGFVTMQQLNEAVQRQRKIFEEKTLPERLQRAQLVSEARLATDRTPLLGQILTDMGFATKEQLDKALNEQKKMADLYKSLDGDKLGAAMEIGFIVNSTLNLAEVLALIMRHANRVTNSIANTLMLLDHKTGELVFSVPTGPKAVRLTDMRLPSGKGIAGWVAEHGQPALIPNVREDPRFYSEIDKISGFETKSILCVPLKAKTKLIGVLEAINKADGTPFTEQDEMLLSVFAYQAAMAIENARLHGELRDRLEEEIHMQKKLAENITEQIRVKEELRRKYRDHLEELLGERTAELTQTNEQLQREIAERKQADGALQESGHQYRVLVETMNEGLAMMDENILLTFVNDKFCQMLGYTRHQLIGRPGTDLHDKANQRILKEQMARQQQGEHDAYEIAFTRKDGQQVFAIISPSPILDVEGHFEGSFAVVTDITERKRAEEELRKYRDKLEELVEERTAELIQANEQLKREIAERKQAEEGLRESEERYRQSVENSPDPIFCIDKEGIIQAWNRSCEQVFQYSSEEIIGQAYHKLLMNPGDLPAVEATLAEIWQGQSFSDIEMHYRSKDSTLRFTISRLYPLRSYRKDVQGCVFANTDITEPRRAVQEREQALAELELKNRELESFTYTVSHDLKAPLVSLSGLSSALQKEFHDQLSKEGKHYLERIQANVAHMDTLITDLLELSRIGQVVGPIQDIDTVALLREVQEELAVELEQVGAEFVVQQPLPVVRADRDRIRQVFADLIDNTVKFRSEERPLRIEVGCQQQKDFYRFHVADNGIGITPQYREKIFVPFQQLDPKAEGMGIGLALVKKIVEHHGGRIWVDSEEGRGATFYFTLKEGSNLDY
jgi:PAS domain S-box-containing protein